MLKRVSIQNFKSLKDVTLDLQKVNLLIGPNNSGKTNFLKALEFFPTADSQTQNIEEIKLFSYKHQIVKVKYDFVFDYNKNTYTAITYNLPTDKFFNFTQESEIEIREDVSSVKVNKEYFFTDADEIETKTSARGGHVSEFYEFIKTIIYRPDPSKLIHQTNLSADQIQLLSDCSNLISFFYYVDSSFRNSFSKQIKEDFSKCVPEIAYFTLPPVKVGSESLLSLRFFDKEENGYWANEVSEGVLYFLALLCIINQPNPPKLLLLEEPEKGIHPRRIREVMDFIFQLAEEKNIQIILTTHNENVLNEFTSMPEAVFVFSKDEEGATQVKNLQKDIIEPSHQRSRETGTKEIDFTSNLGENWMYGLLGGVPEEIL